MTSNSNSQQSTANGNRGRVVFYALFFTIIVAGTVIYFGVSSMNNRPERSDENVDGRQTYQARCAMCHQDDGLGLPGQFPPLVGAEHAIGDPETAISLVLHGMQGPVTVRGVKYNGLMPGLKEIMTDAEIAAALTYVRTSWGNKASAVSRDAVAAVRKSSESRGVPWKAEELK